MILEGDNPAGYADLEVFVAPAPLAAEPLYVRRERDLAEAQRAKADAWEELLRRPDGMSRGIEEIMGLPLGDFVRKNPRLDIGNWSCWADDWDNFTIKYVDGIGWQGRTIKPLRGGKRGGDGTEIKLHVSEHPDQSDFYQRYQLTAVAITPAEQARQTAEAFKQAIPNMGISRQSSKDELQGALGSSHMDSVKAQAAQRGFQSIGLMVGGGGSVIVGGEVCSGFLTGLSGEGAGRTYSITSTAVTIGAEEGVTGFVGLYMSSESADEAGGLEFFSELGAGLGVGVAYRDFTTWGGEFGQMVMVSTGEELELSVGIGETVVTGA